MVPKVLMFMYSVGGSFMAHRVFIKKNQKTVQVMVLINKL